jgi:hypothetical protein
MGERTDFQGDTVWAEQIRLYTGAWEDLRFSAAGINPPGAASDPGLDTEDGCWLFSASATNIIAIQAQMPHEWHEGTELRFHLHWSPTNTNTGNVLWRVEYKVANINEAFPASWTLMDKLDAGSGTADMHQLAAFAAVSMTGKTLSSMIKIKISRIGGDVTDTYNANAKLLEFDIHYLRDALGSATEYVK